MQAFGPKSRAWLADAGITTLEEVRELGVITCYRRVQAAHPDKVSLNLLWALQAALLGIRWTEVPDAIKEQLRQELKK